MVPLSLSHSLTTNCPLAVGVGVCVCVGSKQKCPGFRDGSGEVSDHSDLLLNFLSLTQTRADPPGSEPSEEKVVTISSQDRAVTKRVILHTVLKICTTV